MSDSEHRLRFRYRLIRAVGMGLTVIAAITAYLVTDDAAIMLVALIVGTVAGVGMPYLSEQASLGKIRQSSATLLQLGIGLLLGIVLLVAGMFRSGSGH